MAVSAVEQTTTVANLFEQIGRLYVALETATKERDYWKGVATQLSQQLQAAVEDQGGDSVG